LKILNFRFLGQKIGCPAHNDFATVRGMSYTSQHCSDKTMNDRMALYREQ